MSQLDTPALRTPVLFLIFSRPETTRQVFEAIRKARPPRLYVAADGPRPDRQGEADLVARTRALVTEGVDWPCEVFTLFRDENLGCRQAVSGAITWFFSKEPEGIILEDDCLPSPSFFTFCEELLERHRTDERFAGITGDFRMLKGLHGPDSYGAVGYPLIWGWATWRRVWEKYDPGMTGWTGEPDDFPRMRARPRATKRFLRAVFNAARSGEINTWDFQLNFQMQRDGTSFLHPYVNLITNIGFDTQATHTSKENDPNARLPVGEVVEPLKGPVEDDTYEHWLDRRVFVLSGLRAEMNVGIRRLRDSITGR